ncbi:hypothetical protein HHO41_08600 [Bacillus sp. DNRA2]|uniref:YpoC family protein n=1 Tax=Bacillus sp. DNRA2 TaxID=2723053 RepID=UPI00145C6867|nr:hypothetical protein [Bacillus sp. DNRA2]NMD70352.1 hypothetical protein [Bacillus sp. DNRA2]
MNLSKPWLEEDKYIPQLLQEWKSLEIEIKTLFANRQNDAVLLPMKQGIDLLIRFVFWSNKLPVVKLEEADIDGLLIKPVNFMERIQFLMLRPNLYPSFRQLTELFSEQEKQYSKYLAIEETKRKK